MNELRVENLHVAVGDQEIVRGLTFMFREAKYTR